MIELRNVSKVYNNFNDNYITALRGVNLKLAKTGLTFVVGPSGSGKSTLLNILAGLDVPTSGEMLVDGVSTSQFNAVGLDGYRNNYVGIIYQDYNLLDHLTLGQNVALQLEVQGKEVNQKAISELFDRLGLSGMEDRYPTQCSGGQCQRAAIARVLIKKPKILFADEPTAAVDQEQRIEIYKLLQSLSKEILIIASTHSREMVDRFANRVLTIHNGQIVSDMIASDDKSSAEIFGDAVMAVEPGVKLSYDDIDKLNDLIKLSNKKGTKGVFLCVETEAETVEKRYPVAAKEMQTALKNKQKQKMAQRESRIKMIHEETAGVFQFEATKLPIKSAWGMSLINLRSNRLRSIFTILLSVLAVTFFALSANMSGLNNDNVVMASFSNSNANYLTVTSENELFTMNMKDSWTTVPDSSEHYSKTSLIYDFGPSLTMKPSWGLLPANTQISSVSKLAVINPTITIVNDFGHSIKKHSDGRAMGKWPTAANEIAISDFVATQIRTAFFARDGSASSAHLFEALYDKDDASGVSFVLLEHGVIRYKIVGIYETNYEHYFEFEDRFAPDNMFFKLDGKKYFSASEIQLKSDLTAQERKQAEYLMQHDFVTGYVSQNLIDGVMNGTSVSTVNGLLYDSVPSNVFVGNSYNSVGAANYFMTMHPNGYEMDMPSSNAPKLYSEIFAPSNSGKGLELSKGTWIGGQDSIRVSRGFYEKILGGSVNGAHATSVKRTFTPTFAKRNFSYVSSNNNQTFTGVPSDEIVLIPTPQSYEVLWNASFTVENTGANAFVGELNTDDYIIQFPQGSLNYSAFIKHLVLPSTSFVISNQYDSGVIGDIVTQMSDMFDGNIKIAYSDSQSISEYVATSEETAGIMLMASIVFAVFAVCLMYSYIYSSVRSKRKSIGIIRSMGARPRDVVRIFLLEAILISVLIVLGSFITIALAATIGNAMVQSKTSYSIILFNLNFGFFAAILAATLAVILACYVIPAIAFARHKKDRGLISSIQVQSEN